MPEDTLTETQPAPPSKQANQPSWNDWAYQHMDRLHHFAMIQVRNESDAKDILQNVFVETWNKFTEMQPAQFYGLVCKRIKQRAIDYYRSHERRKAREQIHYQNFLTTSDGKPIDEELLSTVETLPEKYREIISLHIWNEHTFREIATILNISKSTAQTRYQEALTLLRKQINTHTH